MDSLTNVKDYEQIIDFLGHREEREKDRGEKKVPDRKHKVKRSGINFLNPRRVLLPEENIPL